MNLDDIKITPLLDTLYLQKISDSEYFSARFANYISNSRLGLINPVQDGSPEKFFEGFKPIYSSSLDVGSAVHGIVLQPEAFNIVESVDKPTGKMGVMVEELFSLCKDREVTSQDVENVAKKVDYYKGNVTPARLQDIMTQYVKYKDAKIKYLQTRGESNKVDLYLDQKSRQTALACINALQNNKQIQNILRPVNSLDDSLSPYFENEQAILLDIKVEIPNIAPFILKLKAKLDNYVIDPFNNSIQVNDIKTLGRIVSEMNVNIEKFHYNREFAMYSYLLRLAAEKFYNLKEPTITGNYLVVSTIPQYYTKVVPMTKKMFIEGFNEFKYLLKIVAIEVANNHKDFAIWI